MTAEVFIVKVNLDTIIVQVVVWARIYNLEVFRHLYSLCVSYTYTHLLALTCTPALCVT